MFCFYFHPTHKWCGFSHKRFDKKDRTADKVVQLSKRHPLKIHNGDVNILQAIVIVGAVIAIWRGLWGLLDLYLFPEDLATSYGLSVLIGLLVVLVVGQKFIRSLL